MNFEKPTASAFFQMASTETETEAEKGHGRIEVRRCKVSTDIDWIRARHPEWAKLNSIVAVESERHIGEKVSIETRYFIKCLNFCLNTYSKYAVNTGRSRARIN